MMPDNVFETELSKIINPGVRSGVELILNELPDYFWVVASSSTGKYHPSYSNEVGGLVLHTKSAVAIANELMRMNMYSLPDESVDDVIASLLIHDGLKYGKTKQEFTLACHPRLMYEFLEDHKAQLVNLMGINHYIQISKGVLSHSGQWTNYADYPTKESAGEGQMPEPSNKVEFIIHLSDYLSSRKFMNVDINRLY